MKFFSILFLMQIAFLSEASFAANTRSAGSSYRFAIAAQQLVRPENSNEDYFEARNFSGFTLSTAYQSWWFELESNSLAVTTGNATLSTQRALNQYGLWAKKETPLPGQWINILMGVGVGSYHEKITTKLGPSVSEVRSGDQLLAGASIGIRLNVPWIWISLESRAELMQNWMPNPLLSANAKLGLWF